MSNKRLSAICVGTIPSAQKIGWLTYLRDTPTAGFRMIITAEINTFAKL
jgi:hypothetical protein